MTAITPAPAPVRHQPTITRTAGEVSTVYRFVCLCGVAGEEHAARRMAQVDLNEHVLSLPKVPAAERCQAPRAHGRSVWEPCGLCANQGTLFDPAGVDR